MSILMFVIIVIVQKKKKKNPPQNLIFFLSVSYMTGKVMYLITVWNRGV